TARQFGEQLRLTAAFPETKTEMRGDDVQWSIRRRRGGFYRCAGFAPAERNVVMDGIDNRPAADDEVAVVAVRSNNQPRFRDLVAEAAEEKMNSCLDPDCLPPRLHRLMREYFPFVGTHDSGDPFGFASAIEYNPPMVITGHPPQDGIALARSLGRVA